MMDIDKTGMEKIIQTGEYRDVNAILILDSENNILVNGSNLSDDKCKTILKEPSGNYKIIRYNLQYDGCSLVGILDKNLLFKSVYKIFFKEMVMILAAISIIAIALFITAAKIAEQIQKFIVKLRQTTEINSNAYVEVDSNDEFRELANVYNAMLERIDLLIQQVYKQQLLMKDAQIESLQAQINPHFLYNTLDCINSLADMGKTTEVKKTVISLGSIMRMSIKGAQFLKIEEELNNLLITIADLKDILANEERILEIIRNELLEMKEKYGDKRRTEIIQGTFDIEDEDLIPVEDVIISLTNNGYVKRMPVDTYKSQNRGGRGVKGMSTTQDDVISSLIHMSTHDDLLIFTNKGKVYRLKGYNIPEFGRTAKGLPIVNILNLDKDESVKSLININKKMIEEDNQWYLFFATEQGLVKRVDISEFENIRQTGKIAIKLKEDDSLVGVKLTKGDDEILIAASNGKLVRFSEGHVRPMGRSASGVKGINVDGSKVIGMTTNREGQLIMVVTEKGYGKMSPIDEYRVSNRGGKGVKTINVTERNGQIVAIRAVEGNEDLLIITDDGIVIRLPMEQVKTAGRATQGVRLIKVHDSKVSSVEVVAKNEEEVVEEGEEESE